MKDLHTRIAQLSPSQRARLAERLNEILGETSDSRAVYAGGHPG